MAKKVQADPDLANRDLSETQSQAVRAIIDEEYAARQADADSLTPHSDKSWVPFLVSGILLIVVIWIVFSLYKNAQFLESLRDPEYARGVITFLVSVAAISLGFVVVVFAFFGSNEGKTEERFRRAREIFVAMMGVLGTIVGFYFGSTDTGRERLMMSEIEVSESENGNRVVSAFIAGGVPPYYYVITPEGSESDAKKGITSSHFLKIDLKSSDDVNVTLEVIDSAGQSTSKTHKAKSE